ncbi:Lysophosphatidic acid:oleoyl-CoA acyltransferase 1 [Friedmanniomyces endolithicus]|uniref:Lysophosphatidic acid:oleoyl-CoA acyltransferase 1 n=1 Tax=Friedmanniomyces endolithicus TaxID=329885 RepID=A0AAN6JFG3_9PEZI|nr:Lysophosphatidic acid:oleoyl-CoA acyltransferase 1 [Friedmanniomyces endolithicus]KAK0283354.1 Lysophosphatidic acid:oleoyl-CoA acyltransferase 1 [Friedmanniomyces endolithicus]KAK0298618.1 Lysophosphatidic acid:oleoyl-CoA acyltransferase 1 [Friedmanniomyces endolithicus]KAK0310645.1 Lysophosphatidic acid:oleoyl-CoA acyltransferase 1 [Friedmanniomyces endolithicus]KAK0328187.1 Lysophosphatidic acid:oleoyl-CoA acyltransferase 1 [Friedmanniomyces endolithicus]
MEKYGQYRDKGSGIAPFFPIAPPPTTSLLLPWQLFLAFIRIPILTFAWLVWLCAIRFLPAGSLLRKANQWCLLGIPGVWWIDLQVDNVRRGSLSQTPRGRLPYPGTIIASSYTSPLDVLYLAAIFDPIFTQSYRNSRLVRPITQETALANCFSITNPLELVGAGAATSAAGQKTLPLSDLVRQNPTRIIVLFPESTTSNGRGILKLSPSLLSAAQDTRVFPVSLRYTPADVVTPIPGWLEALRFIWRLNSGQTHCIRVRIGKATTMTRGLSSSSSSSTTMNDGSSPASMSPSSQTRSSRTSADRASAGRGSFESNFFDTLQASPAQKVAGGSGGDESDDEAEGGAVTEAERRVLDALAEDLARLGRVKRVDLGVEEKARFVEAWRRGGKKGKK